VVDIVHLFTMESSKNVLTEHICGLQRFSLVLLTITISLLYFHLNVLSASEWNGNISVLSLLMFPCHWLKLPWSITLLHGHHLFGHGIEASSVLFSLKKQLIPDKAGIFFFNR
jgi:hypothetical protein